MTLNERHHMGVVGTREQVAFPMAWNGAVLDFGRTFADGDRIDDLPRQAAWRSAAFRVAHAPPCPKMPEQLFLEHPASLDVQEIKLPSVYGEFRQSRERPVPLRSL